MADFKQVFADEIRRLARKEVKLALEPMQKSLAVQRQAISDLRRQVRDLEKKAGCSAAAAAAVRAVRITQPITFRTVKDTIC